jgi:formiminoglutamase/guanidinobutyrase
MKNLGKWCLLGIPDHEGVASVRGRLGAAHGPRAFREIFRIFKGEDGVLESMVDRGDAPIQGEDAHTQIADWIALAHAEYGVSVIVGGGHDHGYTQLLALSRALGPRRRLGCINVDAHLDVRKPDPKVTSGSPFYLAIEQGVLSPSRFVEFGIQRHCNGAELWNYVRSKKVRVARFEDIPPQKATALFKRELKALARRCDAIVLSFDLDACAQAFAPGVSAPQADGFTSSEALEFMRIAAAEKKVCSLGIFELNPLLDLDFRTARLAATSAYHFIAERLARSGGKKK